MNDFENKELENQEAPLEEQVEASDVSEMPQEASLQGEAAVKKKEKPLISSLYDYIETFCYALALMMVLFLFVFRYVTVVGPSMKQTLHDGDKLIISNLFYEPEIGDIVVINPDSNARDSEPIIKRVIATEGQKVKIDYKNWAVYVDKNDGNGYVQLDEPYIQAMRVEGSSMRSFTPTENGIHEFVIGEGKVFVMGDNRNNSADSRDPSYGQMNENRILGRVVIRIAPNFGFVN